MAKRSGQREKMLVLLRILQKETDYQHVLTMSEILDSLKEEGIEAERKSIYEDVKKLNELGYDVELDQSKKGYYLGDRDFELIELKMLSDTIQASRFLTAKKKKSLIERLGTLCSENEAKELHKNLHYMRGARFENEHVFYILDTLYQAINQNKQVSFRYFKYNAKKQKTYTKEDNYVVSPLALVWDNERYYLLAYYPAAAATGKPNRTFRVDLMESCQLMEPLSKDALDFKKSFDLDGFTESTFNMYSGDVEEVTLTFSGDKNIVSMILDRFGKDITLYPQPDGRYNIHVKVALSRQFYGWVVGVSPDVELTAPQSAVDGLKEHLANVLGDM